MKVQATAVVVVVVEEVVVVVVEVVEVVTVVVQLQVLGQALVHGREGTEVMRNDAIGCYLHLLAFLSALTAAMMATTKGEPNLCQRNGKRLPHRSALCQ